MSNEIDGKFSVQYKNISIILCFIYFKKFKVFIIFLIIKDGNANVQEEKRLSNDVHMENEAVKPVGKSLPS